jgi:hypothetical protein
MSSNETPLQSARRRLREAEVRVVGQRKIIEDLSRDGRSTILATELLVELERVLRNQRDQVQLLQREGSKWG